MPVQGARVFCRFVSASRTRIAVQDGYASARAPLSPHSLCQMRVATTTNPTMQLQCSGHGMRGQPAVKRHSGFNNELFLHVRRTWS